MINFQKASYSINNKPILHDITWQVAKGESWAILGPNGSGKTTLTKILTHKLPVQSGNYSIDPKVRIGHVSFELERHLKQKEKREEEIRHFIGDEASYTSVSKLIDPTGIKQLDDIEEALELCCIEHLLEHDIRSLSTGELRKVIFAKALAKQPDLLILDEPFNGLDNNSQKSITRLISSLIFKGINLVLITHRLEEIPDYLDNILLIKEGRIILQGKKSTVINDERFKNFFDNNLNLIKVKLPSKQSITWSSKSGEESINNTQQISDKIISFQNVTFNHPGKSLLNNLSFEIKLGQQWLIKGPNGSGKTTIIDLILRNNPKVYALDIEVFGTRVGKGRSRWDDLKQIGVVTPELSSTYSKSITAEEVIISGIYDSIGLYTKPKDHDLLLLDQCSNLLPVNFDLSQNFEKLSYGQRQLVLILRAIIKQPKLLILDEPTLGLDILNRQRLLQLVENIMQQGRTSIILTTHYQDELLPSISHVLEFNGDGGYVITERS